MLLSGALSSTRLAAQQNDSIWADIEYIKMSNSWLKSENTAGIHNLNYNNISEAKVYGNLNRGEFVNYYESDNSTEIGVLTESYYRLNKTTTFYGKVGYSSFNGKNMGGSSFIDPNYNPLNIVEVLKNNEVADANRGSKKRELYHLVGGISIAINNKMSLGGILDYKTANYAKRKDLRHVNKLLDLKLSVGACYQLNKNIELGSNYYYERNIESIKYLSEGNKDLSYYSLIDFGTFIGRQELFGESGRYTAENSEKPMVNIIHGVTGQINISATANTSFFNEFGYKSRSGYYGQRGTSSPVLTEHNSNIVEYKGTLSIREKKFLHILDFNAKYESLKNDENVFRAEELPSGVKMITYYGSSEILNKNIIEACIDYSVNIGDKSYSPIWTIKSGAKFRSRKQTGSLYPFYRKQTINNYSVNLYACRNIKGNNMKDMYSISLGCLYGGGSGNELQEGIYTTLSESQEEPNTTNEYLYREYEYLTASRIGGELGFKYSRIIEKNIKAYLQMKYAYTKAFNIKHLAGNSANTINIILGCSF